MEFHRQNANLKEENERIIEKWGAVIDADIKAREILDTAGKEAEAAISEARQKAEDIRAEALNVLEEAQRKEAGAIDDAQKRMDLAERKYEERISEAKQKAEDILGNALEVKKNAELYQGTAIAMKNIIDGYGNQYVISARSLLDDLADEFGYTEAGERLKKIRNEERHLIETLSAVTCEYVEPSRKISSINLVLDSFNGKVDFILYRAKKDNYGKLKQQILDAYNIANYNGQALRNASITREYLASKLEELRLVVVIQELKWQMAEEQKRIREQIREEEKARREIERAIKEAAKEEELAKKAMEKIESLMKLEQLNEEQRTKYEAQLEELKQRLKEAEEKNQRALSMAQQTKRGHVYIISNVGSFGNGVYKIGMTRRLEPFDRVRELGDASVPFPFDVHAMIWSEDAPALELDLHKRFMLSLVNKVNYRKEFFKASLQDIKDQVEKSGVEVAWTLLSEAREYQETLAIEKEISENPESKEAWLNRQFSLEQCRSQLQFKDEEMANGDVEDPEEISA